MFNIESVNVEVLSKRAFNLRWAAIPQGTIPLTAADPDFPCAEPIREAVAKYAREGYFSYGPPEGLLSFRNSLAINYLSTRKVAYSPENILPVDSAAFGIYLTCKTFLNDGDEAIIFDPVDFLFRHSVEAVGAKAVAFPTREHQCFRKHMDQQLPGSIYGSKICLIHKPEACMFRAVFCG